MWRFANFEMVAKSEAAISALFAVKDLFKKGCLQGFGLY